MTESIKTYEQDPEMLEWFKQESLNILKTQLIEHPYPGYPKRRLSYLDGVHALGEFGRLYLPNGAWHAPTEHNERVTPEMLDDFYALGYQLDTENRPLHPWINEMLDPSIGVVTGKGFYRRFGANFTGDPIVVRYDYDEPLLLLVRRNDTGMLALPGGFIEPGETGVQAAKREAQEETLVDIEDYDPTVEPIYTGPLADVRVTANAWPETTAVAFHLNPRLTKNLPLGEFQGDPKEVMSACWFPLAIARTALFGSHSLLVKMVSKKLNV